MSENNFPPVLLSSGHHPYSPCLCFLSLDQLNRTTELEIEQGHLKVLPWRWWKCRLNHLRAWRGINIQYMPLAMVASQDSDTNTYIWQPRIMRIQFPRVLKYVLIFTNTMWCRRDKAEAEKNTEAERGGCSETLCSAPLWQPMRYGTKHRMWKTVGGVQPRSFPLMCLRLSGREDIK